MLSSCSFFRSFIAYPHHASFNGFGDIATYLLVFAMLAWPMSFCRHHASMPPLAWIIPVVSGGRSIMHFVEVIVFLVRLPIQLKI